MIRHAVLYIVQYKQMLKIKQKEIRMKGKGTGFSASVGMGILWCVGLPMPTGIPDPYTSGMDICLMGQVRYGYDAVMLTRPQSSRPRPKKARPRPETTRPRPVKTKTVADKTYIKTQIIAPAMAINRWETGNYTHK